MFTSENLFKKDRNCEWNLFFHYIFSLLFFECMHDLYVEYFKDVLITLIIDEYMFVF